MLFTLLVHLENHLTTHRRPFELSSQPKRLVQPNHSSIVSDIVLELELVLTTNEPVKVATEFLHEDTKPILDVTVCTTTRVPDVIVFPVTLVVSLVCEVLGDGLTGGRVFGQFVTVTLTRSHCIEMVVDPTIPSTQACGTHNGVQSGEETSFALKMIRPSRKILLVTSVTVRIVTAIVGDNVIHVTRLGVNREVTWNIVTVHSLDETTRNLISPITVTCSKVNISFVDTLVKQRVFTPRTIHGVEITSVLNTVTETISGQHALIASSIPDDMVQRVPRGVFDLAVDTVTLKVSILLGSDRVRDLLVVGTVPTGGRVEDVFVGVKVVGSTLVVALDDVDVDELGVFGLRGTLIVLAVNVRGVAVVVGIPRKTSRGNTRIEDAWERRNGARVHLDEACLVDPIAR